VTSEKSVEDVICAEDQASGIYLPRPVAKVAKGRGIADLVGLRLVDR
jgi:hypothetical protein